MTPLDIDRAAAEALAARTARALARSGSGRVRLMEVCGTHTMAIFASGIRALLPPGLELISGPGCPACVTPPEYLDRAIAIAREHSTTLATFGDMVRVPASAGASLERERAEGLDVRVVYSPLDALKLARAEPELRVVFLAVGFETTAPAMAAVVKRAREEGVANFSVLAAPKLIPPAMEAVLAGGAEIDGFICPGHVSVVIGSRAYQPLAEKHGVPCVVAGFEAGDVLLAVAMLAEQVADGRAEVGNAYTRAVTRDGNPAARAAVDEVFETADAAWRGLGVIPGSGLRVRDEFAAHDAERAYPVDEAKLPAPRVPSGCRCGDVLSGRLSPPGCALFGNSCRPESPVGPCMVSSEGSCAAAFRYGSGRARGR
ncbi:MAG: hydrogenase formation protein HypD [Planctomycetota bacterium]|jgi:hydrogenase expression/formation protein HypD